MFKLNLHTGQLYIEGPIQKGFDCEGIQYLLLDGFGHTVLTVSLTLAGEKTTRAEISYGSLEIIELNPVEAQTPGLHLISRP